MVDNASVHDLGGLHRLIYAALLAALTAVGAAISIPLGPVPLSLQTLFVFLAGMVLGPWWGALSMALYLAAGIIGLPVFSGGKSGLGVMFGPTGGFLIGFVLAAIASGLVWRGGAKAGKRVSWLRGLAAAGCGLLALYLPGVVQLKFVIDASWGKAFAVGVIPFIGGAVVKAVLAVAVARALRTWRLLP